MVNGYRASIAPGRGAFGSYLEWGPGGHRDPWRVAMGHHGSKTAFLRLLISNLLRIGTLYPFLVPPWVIPTHGGTKYLK